MPKLHPSYECHCHIPSPKNHLGEDTGLCNGCGMVYDERLYEMRLRQHVAGYTYDTLHDFLLANDPKYRRIAA